MRIFLTGSASCLAKALLPLLVDDPLVEHVYGIDIKPTSFQHEKFSSDILDIRDNNLLSKMRGFDAVIHLAFVVKRLNKTFEEMRDINVRGSSLVVDATIKAGIKKFINMSSVSVYGKGENLKEDTPTSPSATFHYAQHKAELENYISKKLPSATQFRSHLIIGEHAQDFLREMFKSPFWLKFDKRKTPRQQVVHEKDVINAVQLALHSNVPGIFNLSAPQILDLGGTYIKEGIKEGKKIRALPFGLVRFLVFFAKKLRPKDEYTWIEILDTSVTVDCTKAKDNFGWIPKYSVWDARLDALRSFE